MLDYDALITQGHTADVAIQILRGRTARFGVSLVEQFGVCLAVAGGAESRSIALRDVRPGMAITEDVRTHTGTLIVPRGFEVSDVFLELARTFGADLLNQSVKVLVRSTPEVAEERGAGCQPGPSCRAGGYYGANSVINPAFGLPQPVTRS